MGDDLVPSVTIAGGLRQMISADPDQAVGIDRAAAESARLFEDDRPQAQLTGSERPGEAGDAGSENDDVPGVVHLGAGRKNSTKPAMAGGLRRTVAGCRR